MNNEPIAVVGLACRFPGDCNTPEEFWSLLAEGRDAITELDNSRWSTDYYCHPDRNSAGKTYARHAGQLRNVFHFDPEFFGISPREAVQMDPQQRLLLEMTWEALEYGNQIPARLSGNDCSVYIGISGLDYANSRLGDPALADSYFMTGNTLSIAANRISHFFNFHGPSMALDTACSSSLVALHQACRSIWSGESQMSIAGAVHLLLSPFPYIGFSKASMLSPDGRCKVFDARANGYVRSEGGAIFLLKPLAAAESDGDPIYALILATGVNTDGGKPTIVVPEAKAQQNLLERVYTDAGIDPAQIHYVEAHGTGTPVGDPVEALSISSGIAKKGERVSPLLIGSVKSNIGHLETASGAAGLMKVILSLRNRAVPPSLHFHTPNPNIDFQALKLKVVDQYASMADVQNRLLMGVNSFGFGGSNAHVIVAEYQNAGRKQKDIAAGTPMPLILSAKSRESLKARACQFGRLLAGENSNDSDSYDIFYAAARHRQPLRHRLLAWGGSRQELAVELENFSADKPSKRIITAELGQDPERVTFVFSGNGSQWPGMGSGLIQNDCFRETVSKIDEYFLPLANWSIAEILTSATKPSYMNLTEIAQPALFAIQAGILAIFQSRGITADYAIGHSVGEIAAAYCAGILTLEQAVRVVYFRSMAQSATRGMGKMAAAQIAPERARALAEKIGEGLDIAAFNSPNSVTFSGPEQAIFRINDKLCDDGIFCKVLDLEYPFHSNAMDSIMDQFYRQLGVTSPSAGHIEFLSTVTGQTLPGQNLDTDYWWDNLRQPVKFGDAVANLIDKDARLFVEIGPHPVLRSYLHEVFRAKQVKASAIATLKRGTENEAGLIETAAFEICLHSPQKYLGHYFKDPGMHQSLPPYPWNRSEYRVSSTNEAENLVLDHPLIGYKLNSVEWVWRNQIDVIKYPELRDHVIDGIVIYPATAFVEMALAVSTRIFDRIQHEIINLEIKRPLVFEDNQTRDIQIAVNTGDLDFEIRSRVRLSNQPWCVHAVGKLAGSYAGRMDGHIIDLAQLKYNVTTVINKNEIYDMAHAAGIDYGPAFQGLETVWICEKDRLLGAFDPAFIERNSTTAYVLHPAIMDAALHTLFPAMSRAQNAEGNSITYLPCAFGTIRIVKSDRPVAYCLAEALAFSGKSLQARITFLDKEGDTVASLGTCYFRQLPRKKELSVPSFYNFSRVPGNHIDPYFPSPLPGLTALKACLSEGLAGDAVLETELIQYEQVQPLYEALALSAAEKTLKEFGAHMGEFTLDSLMTSSGIAWEHKRFISYLLRMMEDDGRAACKNGIWKIIPGTGADESLPIWRSIVADYPRYQPDMLLTAEYGLDLVNKMSLSLQNILEEINKLRKTNFVSSGLTAKLVRKIITFIIQEWPKDKRRLRIVEISDSPASLSRQLVELFPMDFCDYQLITHDDSIRAKAEYAFKEFPNVRINLIDSSDKSFRHDFLEGEYDILISTAWLYRCDDVLKMLNEFNYLLASGGLLLLCERRPDRIIDMNMGIDPSWWVRSAGDQFPVSRLMDSEDWLLAVEKAEFKNATVISNDISATSKEIVIAGNRNVRSSLDDDITFDRRNNWLLVCNKLGFSLRVAQSMRAELQARGLKAIIVVSDDLLKTSQGEEDRENKPGQEIGFESLDDISLPLNQIVYLNGLDLQTKTSINNLINEQARCCMEIVNILRAYEKLSKDTNPRLWLIGGNLNPDKASEGYESKLLPNQAPLQGLGRVIRNEYPDIDCRHVRICLGQNTQKNALALVTEILRSDDESEVIITRETRKVLRLNEYKNHLEYFTDSGQNLRDVRYKLAIKKPGDLDSLYWREFEMAPPAADEIEIKVMAAGLNFRDVMFAAGMLPDEIIEGGFAGATLGMECAGVVTATGKNVSRFKPGEQVIAFAPSCFASHVITKTTAATLKPAAWSWEEAVTVPTTFFTVYYSLHHLAGLREGETILIHGAAGGVGLAAIQYAMHCGAEVFATAGTPGKRTFLKCLGVEHVLNSRTLEFADEILSLTDGKGVDVVLNSLAGEAVDRNFSLLKPFGRFIELGKRDFVENRKIGLRRFRNNISYFAVDADQLINTQPALAETLYAEMMELFRKGELRPLSHVTVPASDVSSAFRTMQQSGHIGKITVSMQHPPARISRLEVPVTKFKLNEKYTYLVAGGTGGFGFATVKWLVAKGAKYIMLLGRRERLDSEQMQYIDSVRINGVEIQHRQCDIADPVALKKILREIDSVNHPLKGIIHSAMVLDDCMIRNLNDDSFTRVLEPKIAGAWNLHQLTRESNLEFFVLYSSATTCLGNPGQANYVAANAYLEALARYRKSLGLPALAIAWDAIMDTGYLARNESLREAFKKRLGINGITTEQAFMGLEMALENSFEDTIFMNANWSAIRKLLPIMAAPMYANVIHGLEDNEEMGGTADLKELIKGLSREEVHVLISGLLGDEVAKILQLSRDKVEYNRPLQELGVDSLMAMELVAAIESRFSITIPVMALTDNITVDSLAVRITRMVMGDIAEEANIHNDSLLIQSMAKAHAEAVTDSELNEFVTNFERQSDSYRRIIQ